MAIGNRQLCETCGKRVPVFHVKRGPVVRLETQCGKCINLREGFNAEPDWSLEFTFAPVHMS